MNFQKFTSHIIKCIVGAVLIATGILFSIFYTVPLGAMTALHIILCGLGLIALIGGLCGVISARMAKNDPKFANQINNFYDERAILIENKAKAATDSFTATLLLILIIFLAVMQVQPLIILVFVGGAVLRMLVLLYLLRKYLREM